MNVIDRLTYINYRTNRDARPDIPVEVFAKAYPNAAELERLYQAERQEVAA